MVTIELEVPRHLTLLRNKIRERGFTQLEVQEALGWGRSYISQLLTRQKNLRLEQILLILNVIGMDPTEFFGELYGGPLDAGPSVRPAPSVVQSFEEVRGHLRGLVEMLVEKGIITTEGMAAAVETASREIEE